MSKFWRIALPLIIVALAGAVMALLILSRSEPASRVPDPPLAVVRTQQVQLQQLQLTVKSQGTVSPRTQSVLVPEVSGRIVEVAPAFVPGGFFEAGQMLLRVDPHDFRLALIQARSRLAQAELLHAQVEAEAEVARAEWNDLGQGKATPLTLREPQLADARAAVEAAQAGLALAERNLERTEIRAPYAGRVREKVVDLGTTVGPGTALARVYAVDYAEVRLPLPDDQLAFLDLPMGYRGERNGSNGPEVVLRAEFAGRVHEWRGRIVRTEGEIDSRSRMVHAVARVKDPYRRSQDRDRPPLAVGLFVEAEILGRRADAVAVFPRSVIRDGDQVLVVDGDDRVRFRKVEILRTTQREVIVSSGLEAGERVCLSALTAVTDGMRVRTADSLPADAGAPQEQAS